MRRTLLVLSAIVLASFGISYAKPNSPQEKPGSAEPKMTPEDAAKIDRDLKLAGRIKRDGWIDLARGLVVG